MAGSRTLKLSILADVADLRKNLDQGGKDVETFGSKMADFGKKAAAAFAVAGAAVGAYAASAVKAAAEDEKAQQQLAGNLKALAGATDAQVASTEKFISAQSRASAQSDEVLRPALGRLVRATGDVDESQKLLTLALDLSAASGKSVETVSNALAKAYEGNTTSLAKLGLGLDATELKNQSVDTTMAQLATTYGSFAENQAATTEGKFASIKIAQDEITESLGTALLPAMEKLTTFILEKIVPAVESFVAGLTGQAGAKQSLTETEKTALEWGERIKKLIKTLIDFKDEIKAVGIVLATVFVASKIVAFVTTVVSSIRTLVAAMNALRTSSILAGIAAAFALNPLAGLAIGAATIAAVAGLIALSNKQDINVEKRAMGGLVNAGQPYLVGEKGAELFVPKGDGTIVPNNALGGRSVVNNYNINVNGAIDPIGVARSINNILGREATTSGAFANFGQSRVIAIS